MFGYDSKHAQSWKHLFEALKTSYTFYSFLNQSSNCGAVYVQAGGGMLYSTQENWNKL